MKLSKEKYEELYKQLQTLKDKLGINQEILLVLKKGDHTMNGHAIRHKVALTPLVLDLYGTNNEPILHFMLAHELVHVKYQDSSSFRFIWELLGNFGINKGRALVLFMEMRANVMANHILGFSEEHIRYVQNTLLDYNDDLREAKPSLRWGYPYRDQIADYSIRYKEFNNDLMEELLADFCNVMNINRASFSENVIKTFQKKCYPSK